MDASEQAAEQLIRMTLQGSEVVLRLSGAGAKNIAAALVAAISSAEQTKGKTRLANMLKSGKELKVFQIQGKDLADFAKEAKRYGVLYVVIQKVKGDGSDTVDLMVKADDASKLNRIIDKLELASVDAGDVERVVDDIEASRRDKVPDATDRGVESRDSAERLLDKLREKPSRNEQKRADDPLAVKPEKRTQSEPTSGKRSHSEKATTEGRAGGQRREPEGRAGGQRRERQEPERRPDNKRQEPERRSVREKIDEIKRERSEAAGTKKPAAPQQQLNHRQPATKGGRSKTTKGR